MSAEDSADEGEVFDRLLEHISQKTDLDISVIHAFVMGVLCKPINYIDMNNEDVDETHTINEHIYFDGAPPSSLPDYLSDFGSLNTVVSQSNPPVLTCMGVGGIPDNFLAGVGSNKVKEGGPAACRI